LFLGSNSIMNCSKIGESRNAVEQKSVVETKLPQLEQINERLQSQFGIKQGQYFIVVNISRQELFLIKDEKVVRTYPISSSKYGTGSQAGSNKTPLGTHRIAKKTGRNAEIGKVLNYGPDRGKIAEIYTDSTNVEMDLITTRILRLEGLEEGINKGQGIDSYKRHIYVHGTQEEGLIGKPASHGCIRMKNKDVIELFRLVSVGTLVEIQE